MEYLCQNDNIEAASSGHGKRNQFNSKDIADNNSNHRISLVSREHLSREISYNYATESDSMDAWELTMIMLIFAVIIAGGYHFFN